MALNYLQGTTIIFTLQLPENTPADSDFYVTIGRDACSRDIQISKSEMTEQNGVYTGTIPSAVTKELKPGKYYVELLIKNADGIDYVGSPGIANPCFTIVTSMSKSLVE